MRWLEKGFLPDDGLDLLIKHRFRSHLFCTVPFFFLLHFTSLLPVDFIFCFRLALKYFLYFLEKLKSFQIVYLFSIVTDYVWPSPPHLWSYLLLLT